MDDVGFLAADANRGHVANGRQGSTAKSHDDMVFGHRVVTESRPADISVGSDLLAEVDLDREFRKP